MITLRRSPQRGQVINESEMAPYAKCLDRYAGGMTRDTLPSLSDYEAGRGELLRRIVRDLATDDRFSAAWLTGSYGRGEQDAVSDLDLNVLTTAAGAELLGDAKVRGGTSQSRQILFERFGNPLIVHENPFNAPSGSCFSVVVYRDGPYGVDWTLLDPGQAQRPHDSLLLFDRYGVAVQPAPDVLSGRVLSDRLVERWAFFWMMALVSAKYLVRRDDVRVVVMLDRLHGIEAELQQLLAGEPHRFRSATVLDLPHSRHEQAASIRYMCGNVDGLLPQIAARATSELQSGRQAVEALIQLGGR